MPDDLPHEEEISYEELVVNTTVIQEALINLLERKGLITQKELLEEVSRLNQK